MARRALAAVLAPLGLAAALVALPSPASASGCVTVTEYQHAYTGMTRDQVADRFGAQPVDVSSGGAGAVVNTYDACDGVHQALVTFQVGPAGVGHLYTKRWVA